MHLIDQATQTVFADLSQRLIDADFDETFPENGSFTSSTVKGREYWYYESYDALTSRKARKYVGPASDEKVSERVRAFERTKTAFKTRLEAVRMLRAAGLPTPDAMTGAIIERLAKAGFFRLRGVLVGTIAFQTYAGLVGARPDRNLNTGDLDLAQDHGISVAVDDVVDPLFDEVKAIDATFRPLPSTFAGARSSGFINARGYRIEFLVPNRGSDDNFRDLTEMPSLNGVSAQPLRFLDFLIRHPVRSVILHGGGVSVMVPAPERYAVHKLIVATRRQARDKIGKDVGQAAFLIEALSVFGGTDLTAAWIEAWQRGPKWQAALTQGMAMLPRDSSQLLRETIAAWSDRFEHRPSEIGFV